MNKTQFQIVKTFQRMGIAPSVLAKSFKENLVEINKAYAANDFSSYKSDNPMDTLNSMFGAGL